jgi:hypothetical protein
VVKKKNSNPEIFINVKNKGSIPQWNNAF